MSNTIKIKSCQVPRKVVHKGAVQVNRLVVYTCLTDAVHVAEKLLKKYNYWQLPASGKVLVENNWVYFENSIFQRQKKARP